jgi:hypothetical protein
MRAESTHIKVRLKCLATIDSTRMRVIEKRMQSRTCSSQNNTHHVEITLKHDKITRSVCYAYLIKNK